MKENVKTQLKNLKRREDKLLNKKENEFLQSKLNPLMDKIEDKIPDKLKDTLNSAFYKGFQLVFEKGTKYIEKTYNKEKIQLQHDINNYAADKTFSKKSFKTIDKQSDISQLKNNSISVLEGTVLGFLGIGLPDIPLFIAVIMKTIYEIALHYGFDYETESERYYILLIICCAMSKGEEQKEFNHQIELLEKDMDGNQVNLLSLDDQMKLTSDVLSNALLTTKFIQSFAIIGAIGGIINQTIIHKIGQFASLKYKKRYLNKKIKKIRSNGHNSIH